MKKKVNPHKVDKYQETQFTGHFLIEAESHSTGSKSKQLPESEALYRDLLDDSNDLILSVAPDGKFLYVNRTCIEMLGYDHAEINQINLFDVVHPDFHQLCAETLKQLFSGEKPGRIELDFVSKSGKNISVQGIISCRFENDKPVQANCFFSTVYVHCRVENERCRNEELYLHIVENARDIIYTHDLEGKYTSINRAGQIITGYTNEEILQMNLLQTIAPDCLEKAQQSLEVKLNSREETNCDLDIIAKDGRRVTLEVNSRFIYEGEKIVSVQGIARDITERKRANEMLSFQKTLLESLSETSLDGILVVSDGGQVVSYNSRFIKMWELPRELLESGEDKKVLQNLELKVLNPEDFLETVKYLYENPDETHQCEIMLTDDRTFERYSAPVKSAEGKYYGRVWYFRDITERKQLEEKFRQAQKMEAVGRLAGGIAHDFNNLLTAITGYSDLSLKALPIENQVKNNVQQIKKAAERAALLTKQLLAFSRKQVLQPIVFNPNSLVQDVEKMLHRLIGENIKFRLKLDPLLGNVLADPGQIEQVLINLIINARDAMPTGGSLTIETTNTLFDDAYVRAHIAGTQGPHVLLSVTDTGCGMDEKTVKKIFDPFFTTKEKGKGTGLGLSTVYGIVKQSGGCVWVYSEPGLGTTFKIYLPRVDSKEPEIDEVSQETVRGGSETVLMVEDEELLRPLAKDILESLGYQVIIASDAAEAMAHAAQYEGEIHLLLTDVVLPQQNGRELANQILLTRPGIGILFMSGYTDDAIIYHGVLDTDTNFIQKPFSSNHLAQKVREVLDETKMVHNLR